MMSRPMTISKDGTCIAIKRWFEERGLCVESVEFAFTADSKPLDVEGVSFTVNLTVSDREPVQPSRPKARK
jgi:hypothetical protein